MTFLLDVVLRSSAPVLVALLACLLLRHRSAALRHRVLAAAVIAAAAVVPLSVVLPSWGVPLPGAAVVSVDSGTPVVASADHVVTVAPAGAPTVAVASALQFVWLIWIAGVAIGSGLLLLRVARLRRLTMKAEAVVDGDWRRLAAEIASRYGIKGPIVLLTTGASDILATWGLLTPRVLLPAHAKTWSEKRARIVLLHELAHIRRCDWAVQMSGDALRTVFWFNPLLWILCARLRREGERACDDIVLGAGVRAATYASHLVDIARHGRRPSGWMPAVSIARPSTLEGRIIAMLDTRLNRQAPTWRGTAAILVALVAIVFPTASFEVSAQAEPRALMGSVYDTTGLVLPAVDVTLIDEQEVSRSTVTDATGAFAFTSVGTGTYVLEVTLPGFRPLQNEFTLETARDWNRNITMQVGEVEETIRVTARRPAQLTPASSTGGNGPVRVGGNIRPPQKLEDAAPVYPPTMRDAGLEGLVPMEALIGLDGRVASVRVLTAQVHPEFVRAAEEAVRQWVFSPTLLNGTPVEVEMTVSVQFSLED